MAVLSVLGADGGIAKGRRTSCFLVDDDILIDAGTGLGDLEPEDMAKIDHIFLTHVHMDHIACLPLMLDTVVSLRKTPVMVYVPGTDDVSLMKHIFNDVIWPDFTRIPTIENPAAKIVSLSDEPYEIKGRRIGTLPVDHHVQAVGFWVEEDNGKLVLTGDTGPCMDLWESINALDDVRYILVECSFVNELEKLALLTGHLTPKLLQKEIRNLNTNREILTTHIKPVGRSEVIDELEQMPDMKKIGIVKTGQKFNL